MFVMFLVLASQVVAGQRLQDTAAVYFPFDRFQITAEARAVLDGFIGAFREGRIRGPLVIYGFTDSRGSHAYNDLLSRRRSFAVHEYLLNNGIPKTEVDVIRGFGKRAPVNANSTPEERQLNRRVDLIYHNVPQPQVPVTETEPPAAPVQEAPPTDTVRSFSKNVIDSVKEGETLRLKNIHFLNARHTFLRESMPALYELLEVMKNNPTLVIEIQGHICCHIGDPQDAPDFDANNEPRLSTNRARAVYDFLVENGIDPKRMTYRGFAGTVPLVNPELTDADRTLNRRVEIKIIRK